MPRLLLAIPMLLLAGKINAQDHLNSKGTNVSTSCLAVSIEGDSSI